MTDIQPGRIFLSHSTFWSTAYGVGVPSSMNRHCPRTNTWGSGRRERRNRGETAISAAWKRKRCRAIRAHRGRGVKEASSKEVKMREASRWRREQPSRRDEGVKVV